MRVIFLDVDGVLNWQGTEDRIDGFIGFCDERIARFNRIIDAHPDAQIVISSTWRICSPHMSAYQDFEGLIRLFRERGLRGHIIDHTPIYFGHRGRGTEIRNWLRETGERMGVQQFVILDDDTERMEPYVPVRTRWDSDEDWAETMANLDRDLRPYHVITCYDGYPPANTGYNEPQIWEEGGLQDRHVEQAIRVLNGELIPVPPLEEPYRDETWE